MELLSCYKYFCELQRGELYIEETKMTRLTIMRMIFRFEIHTMNELQKKL